MPDGIAMYTYKPTKEEPLVKLADVIKPAPKPLVAMHPLPVEGDEPANSVIWSYNANAKKEEKPEPSEKDVTPGFDFSEKVDVEGKERKIELTPSGLYVFDKKEKFEKPKTDLPLDQRFATPPQKLGGWIGFKKPFSDGKILVPLASKPSDFKTVKVRGRTIKDLLALTKKR